MTDARGAGTGILRATTAHISEAQVLLQEYYEAVGVLKRDSPEEIEAFLSDAASGLWIAYVGQMLAGCVVLRPLCSRERTAECKRLYVRSPFRGRGVADALLDALEEHARAAGLAWVCLDSKDDLQAALRVYQRRGYAECERFNNNPQATVFLRKKLQPPI